MAGLAPSPYPVGGGSKDKGGEGIFRSGSEGDGIGIWIDIDIRERFSYIQPIQNEGGYIVREHWNSSVQIFVLSPTSVPIFDMYCHPEWLDPPTRRLYYRKRERQASKGEAVEEAWTKKVLLKEQWITKCLKAKRFLGEKDNWGGCRVGGPPAYARYKAVKAEKEIEPIVNGPLTPESLPDTELPLDIGHASKTSTSTAGEAPLVQASMTHAEEAESATADLPDVPLAELSKQVDENLSEMVEDSSETVAYEESNKSPEQPHEVGLLALPVVDGDLVGPPSVEQVGTANEAVPTREAAANANADVNVDAPADAIPVEKIVHDEQSDEPIQVPEADSVMEVDEPTVIPDEDVPSAYTEEAPGMPAAHVGPDDIENNVPQPTAEAVDAAEVDQVMNILDPDPEPHSESSHEHESVHSESEEEETIEVARPNKVVTRETALETAPSQVDELDEDLPQEVSDPTRIFWGLLLFVDPAKANRNEFLRKLTHAGGVIETSYTDATHVLISGFPNLAPSAKKYWTQISTEISKTGVWFIDVKWAIKCLEEGRRLPEASFAIPGGSPPGSTAAPVDEARVVGGGAQNVDVKPVIPKAAFHRILNTEEIVDIFEKEKRLLEISSDMLAARTLVQEYGQYTLKTWKKMIASYRARSGQFANIPTPSPNRASKSAVDVAAESGSTAIGEPDWAPKQSSVVLQIGGPSRKPVESRTLQKAHQQPLASQAGSSKPTYPEPFGPGQRAAIKYNEKQQLSAWERLEQVPRPPSGLDAALDKAYRICITKRITRINIRHKLIQDSGFKTTEQWLPEYVRYHDRVVAQQITDEEIEGILRDSTQGVPYDRQVYLGITDQIEGKIGILDLDGWRNKMDRWLVSTGQIRPEQGLGTIPIPRSLPPRASEAVNPRTGAFMSLNDIARIIKKHELEIRNTSATKVARKLALKHRCYAAPTWASYISEWTRGAAKFQDLGRRYNPPPIELPDTSVSSEPGSGVASQSRAPTPVSETTDDRTVEEVPTTTLAVPSEMSTEELGEIFEEYASLSRRGKPRTEIGELINERFPECSAITWAVLYGQWQAKSGRFAPPLGDGSAEDLPGGSRLSKRSADSASVNSVSGASKKRRNEYTEEEERAMALHIIDSLPEPARTTAKYWQALASQLGRSAPALSEHYRGHRDRIDRMVMNIQSVERAMSVSSSDSSVVAVETPVGMERNVKTVDMTGIDSD